MSRTEKYLEPNRVDAASSIAGNGYRLNLVTAFRARKSTQNLNLGLPSKLFLGTRMAGADQGKQLSLSLLVLTFFYLGFHFVPECRCSIRWVSYGWRVSYRNLVIDYISGLKIVSFFIVKGVSVFYQYWLN